MDGSIVFARWRQCAPQPNITCFHAWAHPSANSSSISFDSAVFAQLTAESRHSSQRTAPFPFKIASSRGRIWTPSNTRFLVTTRVLNRNGISIISAVFCSAHGRAYLYVTMDRPSPSKLPLPMWGSGPHLIYDSWAHPSP